MKEVIEFLEKSINENDKVVIACSGGPDSMALLSLLCNLRNEKKFDIICAHVNHNKRKESASEALMVEKYCKENAIIFEGIKFEKYEKGNFEAVARKKRYEFFEEVMKKHEAHKLFTAHHGDDLAETILMRLTRGSTLKGYSGFTKYNHSEWYELYRPLVYMTKQELLDYVNENNIPYAIDKTNTDTKYTRNRFRHEILLELKKEEPNIDRKLLKFSEKLDEAASFINEMVSDKIEEMYKDNSLDLIKFNYEKPFIQKMMIKELLSRIYDDDVIYLKDSHVEIILRAVHSDRPNLEVVLPKGMRVLKRYDKLIFTNENETKDSYHYTFDEKIEIGNHTIEEIGETNEDGNDICRLNIEDIKLPLIVRNRIAGDKMTIKGMEGTKKIKEIFIECHISKEERDKWPILVDSRNEIVWLPGLKKSKYNKQKNEKCDIILKYH